MKKIERGFSLVTPTNPWYLKYIYEHDITIVTGRTGTGKTTLLQSLKPLGRYLALKDDYPTNPTDRKIVADSYYIHMLDVISSDKRYILIDEAELLDERVISLLEIAILYGKKIIIACQTWGDNPCLYKAISNRCEEHNIKLLELDLDLNSTKSCLDNGIPPNATIVKKWEKRPTLSLLGSIKNWLTNISTH